MRYGRSYFIFIILSTFFLLQGCSVFMAATQPDRKDVSLFKVGTPRDVLLAEFGKPMTSEEKDGKKYEIFSFVQGYGTGTKIGRAFFHGTADVFSLGLWEVVGTPTEVIFDGTKMSYKVSYDNNDCVDSVTILEKTQPKQQKTADPKVQQQSIVEEGSQKVNSKSASDNASKSGNK